jgi:hypothetical protein
VRSPVPITASRRLARGTSLGLLPAAACVLLAVTACAPARATAPPTTAPAATAGTVYGPVPVPRPQLTPSLAQMCGQPAGFSCGLWQRIGEVKRYIAHRPGTIGVELYDRDTGASWGNRNADTDFPAASTIKLAMVTDLMRRADSGQVTLGPGDWQMMDRILYDSDDAAGDELWSAYDDGSFLGRIQRFGMRSASFSASTPYWGFMYCSPHDLDSLMNYVLDKLPARDRGYIVHRMRRVGPIEQWGVWGAGGASHPGDKDGWENEGSVWVTNTVGFAGPHEEYTLAIMDNQGGAGDFHTGATTLSEIASLLFRGHLSPAPTAEATPNAGSPVPY